MTYTLDDDNKALKWLIGDILARGYSISVNDGDGWPIKQSRDPDAIFEAANGVFEAWLKIHDEAGASLGIIAIVFGNDPSELIADYSWNTNFHEGEVGPMFAIEEAFQGQFAQ